MTELNPIELATVSGGTTTSSTPSASTVDTQTQTALAGITSSLSDLKNQKPQGMDSTTAMCMGLMLSKNNSSTSNTTVINGGGGGFFHSWSRS